MSKQRIPQGTYWLRDKLVRVSGVVIHCLNLHDHELCSACQLASIVVGNNAADTATQVDKYMCVYDNGAKFDNKDPEIMQPKAFVLVVNRYPALLIVRTSFTSIRSYVHTQPPARPK